MTRRGVLRGKWGRSKEKKHTNKRDGTTGSGSGTVTCGSRHAIASSASATDGGSSLSSNASSSTRTSTSNERPREGLQPLELSADSSRKSTANGTASDKESESILYHKSMLGYPLITMSSTSKKTRRSGSGSTSRLSKTASSSDDPHDDMTLVSVLTDFSGNLTAINEHELESEDDFSESSIQEEKEETRTGEDGISDDITSDIDDCSGDQKSDEVLTSAKDSLHACNGKDDHDKDYTFDGDAEDKKVKDEKEVQVMGGNGSGERQDEGRRNESDNNEETPNRKEGMVAVDSVSATSFAPDAVSDASPSKAKGPTSQDATPITPTTPATENSETYCYLTLRNPSDVTAVSSLGELESPCRAAIVKEFTERYGRGPNSHINTLYGSHDDVDLGRKEGAQEGSKDEGVSLVDLDGKVSDPIEAERMSAEMQDKAEGTSNFKGGPPRASMLGYRPSTSQKFEDENRNDHTSATFSTPSAMEPSQRSQNHFTVFNQGRGFDVTDQSDVSSGWQSPRTKSSLSEILDSDDNSDAGMTLSKRANEENLDEISRFRANSQLDDIICEPDPVLLRPAERLEAEDEISRCRAEIDNSVDNCSWESQPASTSTSFHAEPVTSDVSKEAQTETSRLNEVGANLLSQGKMDKALSIYRQAVSKGREEINKLQRQISALHSQSQSHPGHSNDSVSELVDLNRKIGIYASHAADSLNNAGVVYDLKNDYDAAIASCENALDLYLNTAHRPNDGADKDVERTLENIAQMEHAKATWPKRKLLHKQDSNAANLVLFARDSSERKRLSGERINILRQLLSIEMDSVGKYHPQVAKTMLKRGLVYVHMGNYDEGITNIRHSASLYRTSMGEAYPEVGRALAKLAQAYHQRNDNDIGSQMSYGRSTAISSRQAKTDAEQAILFYREAIHVLRTSIGNGPEVGFLLNNVGKILLQKSRYQRALEAFSAASASFGGRNRQTCSVNGGRTINSFSDGDAYHPEMARIWSNIGDCLMQKKDFTNSIDAFEFVLIVIAQNKRKREICGMTIGGVSSEKDYDRIKYSPLRNDDMDDISEITPDHSLSQTEIELQIVAPRSELDDSILMAHTFLNIGSAQTELGWLGKARQNYDEAHLVVERCLKTFKLNHRQKSSSEDEHFKSLDIARILERLANQMMLNENLSTAMLLYDKCTGLLRTMGGDDYISFARLLGKKAAIYMKMGNYQEAISILTEVINLFRTKGMPRDHPELVQCISMLHDARFAAEHNNLDHSSRRSSRSVASKSKPVASSRDGSVVSTVASSTSIDLAFAFDKKAEHMRKSRRYEEAYEACLGALKIRRMQQEEISSVASSSQKKKLKIDIGRTLRNQAFLQVKMAEYSKARDLYREALDLYEICGLQTSHPYVQTATKELKAIDLRVYEENTGSRSYNNVVAGSMASSKSTGLHY